MRRTHTFAELEVSPTTWDEIAWLLREAGYHHVFIEDGERTVIDMAGIGLTKGDPQSAIAESATGYYLAESAPIETPCAPPG